MHQKSDMAQLGSLLKFNKVNINVLPKLNSHLEALWGLGGGGEGNPPPNFNIVGRIQFFASVLLQN